MNGRTPDCEPCEAEALHRILGVRDLLDAILWGEARPVPGVTTAILGLKRALNCYMVAGIDQDDPS